MGASECPRWLPGLAATLERASAGSGGLEGLGSTPPHDLLESLPNQQYLKGLVLEGLPIDQIGGLGWANRESEEIKKKKNLSHFMKSHGFAWKFNGFHVKIQ